MRLPSNIVEGNELFSYTVKAIRVLILSSKQRWSYSTACESSITAIREERSCIDSGTVSGVGVCVGILG